MTNDEIARFFSNTQVEGWFRTRQHFRNSSEHAILQIPVGCGKTGLMALLPFGIAQGRVLVIAPNLEIRRGISTAFDIAGRDCFWASTRVLTDVNHGPYTAILDGQEKLYFVVETKSSNWWDDLRHIEGAKIKCGKKHFKELAVEQNPARYIKATSVDDMVRY